MKNETKMENKSIIISRHPATIAWLKEVGVEAPVASGNVGAEDVRGKVVYGNIPLHLAAEAAAVYAVTLPNDCPRGQELDLEYLRDNACLQCFWVERAR